MRVETVWEVWTYDVWGNAKDGYEVNDRSCVERSRTLLLTIETFNAGKPGEFQGAYPSDRQIRQALGINRTRIETDGDKHGNDIGRFACKPAEVLKGGHGHTR